MAKKINYNARTFADYKKELNSLIKKYYPTVINDFNDASIGQFFIDINAAVADDLGFYSDRMFQETQIDQAQERKSLLNIARSNGLKITGKKPSIVEAEWSCVIPFTKQGNPDWEYAPTLKRGTQASGGGQRFELTEDVNFAHQFNKNGMPDRSYIPVRDNNNSIVGYKVSKTCIMSSTESKVYKQPISSGDVSPFMEIVLPENNVVKINSILLKAGYNTVTPTTLQFMDESINRNDGYERWYEVENLLDTKKFMKNSGDIANGFVSGEWRTLTKKFITEYTDNGYCKIIFGGGMPQLEDSNPSSFSQYLINNMISNSYLGEIPSADSTLFIYYSVGGGAQSNIGARAMTNITYLDLIEGSGSDESKKLAIRDSIRVVNTIPSVSGRDEFTVDELRYLIKYNNGAQDRCVTITDYLSRVMLMPSEFGSPFKVGVAEENNKVIISLLGLSNSSNNEPNKLSNQISEVLMTNIKNYLKEYKSINDYVEIKAGKIINLRFEVDIMVENNMRQEDVSKEVGLKILNFMDINKHKMGDEIFISRLKSLIGMTTGVKNLIDLRVYNVFGGDYSLSHVTQPVINNTRGDGIIEINLDATDGVLYSNNDTMFEIKKPGEDIIINAKYSI